MKYEFKSRIRFSECDENRNLSLPGLVNYYQDTCTFQGDDLHVGMDLMQEKGSAWIITYWQIDVQRLPKASEYVTFSTWPYAFHDFYGYRNFTLEDENGEMLSRANSVWVLIDLQTQRPTKVYEELKDTYELLPKLDMEYVPRKIRLKKEGEAQISAEQSFTVEQYHLDANHHVNNGQYINMAYGYLAADYPIARMRAEYRKQARLGDRICPLVVKDEKTIQVALNDENGKTYAVIEFERKTC